jgi:hypothetical protein
MRKSNDYFAADFEMTEVVSVVRRRRFDAREWIQVRIEIEVLSRSFAFILYVASSASLASILLRRATFASSPSILLLKGRADTYWVQSKCIANYLIGEYCVPCDGF